MGEKANPFWSELKLHLEQSARKSGIKIRFFWPSSARGIVEDQLRVFRRMLALGFDLVIVNPLNRSNLAPAILEACRRKIPVLDVGAKTDPAAVAAAGSLYVPVRTVDFYRQGVLGARYIAGKINPRTAGNVAILEGRKEAAQSLGRSQGAADAFGRKKIRIARRESADFERKKARSAAARIIAEDPSVGAFFCVNDLMALGVADAIMSRKSRRKILVVGVDLVQDARRAIRAGQMDASVAFSTASVAEAVLRSALRVLKGQTVTDACQVKSFLIDRGKLDQWDRRAP
jgi:ribose transport system substrate-binding protein/D-allose transport system substrate-binding protein